MNERGAPHLSFVVVSRNDDHGGALLQRMQVFLDALDYQCRKFGLDAELVLVEWNPPADRQPLRDALRWPEFAGPLTVRIVQVPREIHARYKHGDRLPLYQMIGKNAGIRRARAEFVLATNIDIIFDDATIEYLRDHLQQGVLLRTDRFDVPSTIPPGGIDDKLNYWRRNIFQVYTRFGIYDAREGGFLHFGGWLDVDGSGRNVDFEADLARLYSSYVQDCAMARESLSTSGQKAGQKIERAAGEAVPEMLEEIQHGNRVAHMYACGDFTLLSRRDWVRLAGYPELDAYSWDIDSVLIFAAFASGIRQVALPPSYRIFHIDHSRGSGWTPEGHDALFERLRAKGIPFLADGELYAWRRRLYTLPETRVLNDGDWGLAGLDLPEIEPASQ